jgi:hypothetical protein
MRIELCGGEMYPENNKQFDKKRNYLCNSNDKTSLLTLFSRKGQSFSQNSSYDKLFNTKVEVYVNGSVAF